MDALVRNFRGIERAQIQMAPIALLAGKNHVGKSSVCQAVAAALTGMAIPFIRPTREVGKFASEFTKTEAKELVRAGTDDGSVSLSDGGTNNVKITWPKLDVSSNGKPPAASVYAAGLVEIMKLEPMYRFELLTQLLQTTPTDEDVTNELKDKKFDDDTIKQVLAKIAEVGFDGAHKALASSTTQLKGRWEEATGEAFGLKKMLGWKPEGYELTPGVTTEEEIVTIVANARQALETAIAAQAVDGAEIERLNKQAPLEYDAQQALNAATTELEALRGDLKRAQDDLAALEVPSAPLACPECGAYIGVTVKGDTISVHRPKFSPSQITEANTARDNATGRIVLCKTRMKTAETKHSAAVAEHGKYAGAKAALEKAVDKKGSAEDVSKARECLVAAEKLRDQFVAVYKAAKYAATIGVNVLLLDVLEPEGLRRSKLAKKLQLFNQTMLVPLTTAAGYQPVTIDEKLDVRCGGRNFYLLSESEKFRVNVVLQIAIALLDNSAMVVIDGADILDTDGRNGLFAMLSSAGERLKSLVGMTVSGKKGVPDLAKHGMGQTYWIENGACAEFKV